MSFFAPPQHTTIHFEFVGLVLPVTSTTPAGCTWLEWKRLAVQRVLQSTNIFKKDCNVSPADFALKVPIGNGGIAVLCPESVHDDKVPDRTLLHTFAAAQGGAVIYLYYMPVVRVCTYDNLEVSVPSFGHWLQFCDLKSKSGAGGGGVLSSSSSYSGTTTSNSNNSGSGGAGPRQTIDLGLDNSTVFGAPALVPIANDAALNEDSQEDLGKLLNRTAIFMKDELEQASDTYVISVGFGQFMRREENSSSQTRMCARVQLSDPRIHLLLLLKYETNLMDEVRVKYLTHARHFWLEARHWTFRQFAVKDSGELDRWLKNHEIRSHMMSADPHFKLPKGFSWDEYGRQQLTTELSAPLCDLTGALGGLNPKLKVFVRSVQAAANSTSKDVLLSVHDKTATLLLTVRDYLLVLSRAGADPMVWGNALAVALRDSPDVLYAQLFSDFGLSPKPIDELQSMEDALHGLDQQAVPKIGKKTLNTVVDQAALPLSIDVIRKIEGRNKYKQRFSAGMSSSSANEAAAALAAANAAANASESLLSTSSLLPALPSSSSLPMGLSHDHQYTDGFFSRPFTSFPLPTSSISFPKPTQPQQRTNNSMLSSQQQQQPVSTSQHVGRTNNGGGIVASRSSSTSNSQQHQQGIDMMLTTNTQQQQQRGIAPPPRVLGHPPQASTTTSSAPPNIRTNHTSAVSLPPRAVPVDISSSSSQQQRLPRPPRAMVPPPQAGFVQPPPRVSQIPPQQNKGMTQG